MRLLALTIGLVVLATAATAQPRWSFTGPSVFTPIGVAQTGNTVFFAAALPGAPGGGLVYRSPDGGQTWAPTPARPGTAALPNGTRITAIGAADGLVAVAGVENRTTVLYTSTTDGASWTRRATLPAAASSAGSVVRAVLVVDARTLVVYANENSLSAYVYASTDGGATWTSQPERFAISPTDRVPVLVGSRLFKSRAVRNTQTRVTQVGLYVSDDLGATWAFRVHTSFPIPSSLDVPFFTAVDGARVYHHTAGGLLFWTDDGGLTFGTKTLAPTPFVSETFGTAGSVLGFKGQRLVARGYVERRQVGGQSVVVADHLVGVSDDFGDSWTQADPDSTILRSLEGNANIFGEPISFASVPAGFLYTFVIASTNGSALYFSPDGRSWTPTGVNGFPQDVGNTFPHGGAIVAFEHVRDNGFFRSRDGAAWRFVSTLNNGASPTCSNSGDDGLAASVGDLVVAVCPTNGRGVFHSRDGLNFVRVADAPSRNLKMMVEEGGRLFAIDFDANLGGTGGQRGHLYRSDDAGLTWTTLASDLRSTIRPSVSGDRIVLAEAGKVYFSTDGGASFATAFEFTGSSGFVGAAATPTALFVGAAQTSPVLNQPRLFRSLDGGTTWEDLIARGAVAVGPTSLHGLEDGSVVGVFQDSVAVSRDDGLTWHGLAAGWPAGRSGKDAFVFKDTLYVQLYDNGLWRAALADVTGGTTVAAAVTPDAEALDLRAAPNPASASTTVRFSLGAPARALVTVVDVLGRTVATLADGDLPAGPHALSLGTAELARGVYVVRLALADGRRATRVLTVAR